MWGGMLWEAKIMSDRPRWKCTVTEGEGETYDAYHPPFTNPAKTGLLQPVVVPKGPGLQEQVGISPETVPCSNS